MGGCEFYEMGEISVIFDSDTWKVERGNCDNYPPITMLLKPDPIINCL